MFAIMDCNAGMVSVLLLVFQHFYKVQHSAGHERKLITCIGIQWWQQQAWRGLCFPLHPQLVQVLLLLGEACVGADHEIPGSLVCAAVTRPQSSNMWT